MIKIGDKLSFTMLCILSISTLAAVMVTTAYKDEIKNQNNECRMRNENIFKKNNDIFK